MNILLRLIDCLDQVIFAMQCQREFHSLYGKKTKAKGLQWLGEKLDDIIGAILFNGILAYGIYKGWVKMPPPYLGDGYEYDNFGGKGHIVESFVEN